MSQVSYQEDDKGRFGVSLTGIDVNIALGNELIRKLHWKLTGPLMEGFGQKSGKNKRRKQRKIF